MRRKKCAKRKRVVEKTFIMQRKQFNENRKMPCEKYMSSNVLQQCGSNFKTKCGKRKQLLFFVLIKYFSISKTW